ncbi:MAG: histidinol dehydrogenase [Deltaproteobacteria bacterium]|nr:MAG: histidinol dehydrogenase [Deltaproteobacteria bacterium]
MILPSIDLQGGHAVQLVGGKDLALDAGDPLLIAERFAVAGELSIVDLDAALGQGDNSEVIEALLRRYRCRIGGGIRSVEAALRWLDAGAHQIVLGTAARPEVLKHLPADRVIAALDAVDGEVVVEGWRTRTGRGIAEVMAELRPFVSGFLVTFVEKEGRLGGTSMERVEPLIQAAQGARLTIAGGVTTAAEVAALDRLGADAQVGMALYTGRMTLAEALWAPLRSDRPDGLVPTVITDEHGGALGLAYSSEQSFLRAVQTRRGVYWSRSRQQLWEKGATSGATQTLLRVGLDCDRDALRFVVRQGEPGFCHLGTRTCWGSDGGLPRLDRTLAARRAEAPEGSYTRRLFDDPALLAAKLREETEELIEAATKPEITHEAADLIFFALTRAHAAGVDLAAIGAELDRRTLRVRRRGGHRKEEGGEPTTGPLLRRIEPKDLPDLQREPVDDETLRGAKALLDEVRRGGVPAVRALAERFGDRAPREPLLLGPEVLKSALEALPDTDRGVLERVAGRIRRFAEARRADCHDTSIEVAGGRAGVRLQPVQRAGCYAPGGRYPLPSSVLMTAITARAAGVAEVYVASPRPSEVTLAAAALAGANGVLAVGGVQAIGALAFGLGVPRCDAIVGPGNRWVTAAKQLVSGRVAIDMLAGPSELLVIADAHADPDAIAADLLAQAEHDPDAGPMLCSDSAALIEAVEAALHEQLATLPTADVARRALRRHGFAVKVDDLAAACVVANQIAPEHLALHVADPRALQPVLLSYGALFLGEQAAEVLGDYGAGPNHVLPTGGSARAVGALDVLTFLRPQGSLDLHTSTPQTRAVARDAAALAHLEGLEAHARAAERRG